MRLYYLFQIFLTAILLTPQSTWSQDETNSYDNRGKRHGYWKEYFSNSPSSLKFEGEFRNGQKIGLFKFYQEGLKHPVAIMDFHPATGKVKAKYLTQKGKTISEGEMLDQLRNGIWTYYHKDSDKIMMTETYKNGKLEGVKKTFYDNGKAAEEAYYLNGELHGPRKLFSVKGVVLEDLNYRNGELHGPAKFYNGKGELMSEGQYKHHKHSGIWRYYENGNLKEEKEF